MIKRLNLISGPLAFVLCLAGGAYLQPAHATPVTYNVNFSGGPLVPSGSITFDDANATSVPSPPGVIVSNLAPVTFSFVDTFSTWTETDIIPGGLGAFRF